MGVAPKYMIIIKKTVVEPDVTLIVINAVLNAWRSWCLECHTNCNQVQKIAL